MIEGFIIGFIIGFGLTSLFVHLIYLKFVKNPMKKLIKEAFSSFLDFSLKNNVVIPRTVGEAPSVDQKIIQKRLEKQKI